MKSLLNTLYKKGYSKDRLQEIAGVQGITFEGQNFPPTLNQKLELSPFFKKKSVYFKARKNLLEKLRLVNAHSL